MRFLLYLVVGVIVLTLLRSILEAIGKAFSGGHAPTLSPPNARSARTSARQTPQSLKKDPVCGTFVSMETALHKNKGGETYYFCSPECRDKF